MPQHLFCKRKSGQGGAKRRNKYPHVCPFWTSECCELHPHMEGICLSASPLLALNLWVRNDSNASPGVSPPTALQTQALHEVATPFILRFSQGVWQGRDLMTVTQTESGRARKSDHHTFTMCSPVKNNVHCSGTAREIKYD